MMKRHSTQREMSWDRVLNPATDQVWNLRNRLNLYFFPYCKIDWQEKYYCFYFQEGCYQERLNGIMCVNMLWRCVRYYMQKVVFKFKIVEFIHSITALKHPLWDYFIRRFLGNTFSLNSFICPQGTQECSNYIHICRPLWKENFHTFWSVCGQYILINICL